MTTRHYGLSAFALLCLGILISMIASEPAMAQHFENAHGDSCVEEGYGGRAISTGGYISVGVTYSVDARSSGRNCATAQSDVYVVKLNSNGSLAWMRTYNIGGNDVGYDIIELTNGDFAICGVTDNNHQACSPSLLPHTKGFIMRITAAGAVVWCRTYGDSTRNELFRRLIQARFGSVVSSAGDICATGYSQSSATAGGFDGYTVRVNQLTGAIIWSNLYGGAGNDEFRSLIETRIGTRGNLVMVGQSTSFNSGGVPNSYIVRCNGTTGAVVSAASYGGSVNNYLWSVCELTVGRDSGDLAYAGGIIPSGFTAPEIYLLKTAANPCTYLTDHRFGDNGNLIDEASTIRELSNISATSLFGNGTLYVTGHSYIRPGGNGDAFLMLNSPANLGLIGNFHLYGEKSDEGAWYEDYVPPVAGQSTEGIYLTGRALSTGVLPSVPLLSDPDQMYLLKTDNALTTLCCDTIYAVFDTVPGLPDTCPTLQARTSGRSCAPQVRLDTITTWRLICSDSIRSSAGHPIHKCDSVGPTTHPDGSDLSRLSAIDPDAVEGSSAELSVSSFPNPVQIGETFTMQCELRSASHVEIVITDVAGTVIYRSGSEQHAGGNAVRIATSGWQSGTYLVKVTAGSVSETRRVVVLGK